MFDTTESVVRREMHAGCSEKRVSGCNVRGFEEETKQKKQQEREREGGRFTANVPVGTRFACAA